MGNLLTNPFAKDHFYETVGRTIRQVRNDAGKSQQQLADSIPLTLTTIQNAETGASCSLLVLARIAEALDVTLDELVPLDAVR